MHAVRVVANGDALLAPSVTRRIIEQFAGRRPRAPRSATALAELTDREREVLVLIGKGRSNTEIGGRPLHRGADRQDHVGKVLAKLNLRDRVHAVILAYDTGLVEPSS